MKKNNKKWLVWTILGVLIAGGLFYWIKRDTTPKIQLETTYPTIGDISQSITATGKIEPVDTVAVGTQVSGTIKNIYVDFNSKVKKGQLLAVLDPELLRDQMLQMNANLQSAKSNQAYNEINFNRQSQLYKVGAISKADYDNAQNAYNASRAQVGAVSAQLAAANKNLSLTSIYSPIDGTVLNRNISEGQTVAASFSTPTLFSIAKDLSKMQVRATIDEADIGNVQAGQKVSFTVDAFPNESFNGTVSEVRLQPTISANVVNYITMINADNTSLKLKPGMTANITVTTKELPKVMKIPTQAIAFHPDSLVAKSYVINAPAFKNKKHKGAGKQGFSKKGATDQAGVWILNKDNTIVHKKIKTGMDNDTEIQVVSGLEKGDNIITGYKMLTKKSSKGAAKSPFLPQRSGGRGNNAGSGGPR
ncbi:efflux RND transporter periplasmic adaptor subunit [Elizabethkingia sp. HX WHF]|uniref:efflux RND transporter periplasmic adaptor subunit n=1 Tax=Elizabethkingia TaxID=308865 RepID=UPI00099AAE2A|nr:MULTISPECIES: efflux RND transporter periplasmic adaptor subunit [Elizabethkingia]ATL45379.1 efflux RND transporter periplasmic adaptor subunit [Elizabethkingia miricola]MCL1636348.1 efflux RND transporter periplasmic adaptor subunit [Elizabethkingia bruuniana]MDX8562471.1 efflux RND transporter periplasmic adaptor subunit [Elizabethkingia sp. HX WHF]OPC22842.1 efflux transporter periplasmic adaptor subunit [Elizabethkingia bruuniana]